MSNDLPMPWTPTTVQRSIVGGQVRAGDWVQVTLSYRASNSSPVVALPGHFLVHVVYQPNADAYRREGQPSMYGGAVQSLRSEYRIDPGFCFQAPWDGQVSVVAGGDSNPTTCVVDVNLRRGHTPIDWAAKQAIEAAQWLAEYPSGMPVRAPAVYAPPVTRSPHLVPATWVEVPAGASVIFPDGAASLVAVDDSGIPANPVQVTITALGAARRVNLASGLPLGLGALAQGGGASNGVAATWAPIVNLQSATVWSSLGC